MLDNIFTDEKKGKDWKLLPTDSKLWQQEIMKSIYKRVPAAATNLLRIDFKKKTDEKGYAVGSATISKRNGDAHAVIPLIVKEFYLSPLDVFIVNGVFYPMDEFTFGKFMGTNQLFSNTITRPEYDLATPYGTTNLYYEMHPPFHNKQASMGSSTIDSLLSTLTEADVKEFKQDILRQPNEMNKLASVYEIQQTIKKVCSHKPQHLTKTASTATDDVVCCERMGFNKYKVLSNHDANIFSPEAVVMDYQMMKTAGIDEKVAKSKGIYFKKPGTVGTDLPFVEDVPSMMKKSVGNIHDIDTCGTYSVRTPDGTDYRGSLIPHVVNFDLKPQKMKLFVSDKNYAYQGKMVGVKIHDEFKLSESKVEAGAYGTLVYESNNGKMAFATVPFEVSSMTTCGKKLTLHVQTDLGTQLELVVTPGLQTIAKDTAHQGPARYFVPMGLKFVALEKLMPVVESEKSYEGMTKEASATATQGAALKIMHNDGQFVFSRPGIEKYAGVNGVNFDMNHLSPFDAQYLLLSFGATPDLADNFLKTAAFHGRCSVQGLHYPVTANDSSVMEKQAKYKPLFNHIQELRTPMIKEAAALIGARDTNHTAAAEFLSQKQIAGLMDDQCVCMYKLAADIENAQLVDSVLSLNFVNTQNIKNFVSMKPQLELSASKLAQLLVAARLGVTKIPENETATAMNNLSAVIEGLELLSNSAG